MGNIPDGKLGYKFPNWEIIFPNRRYFPDWSVVRSEHLHNNVQCTDICTMLHFYLVL